MHLINWNTITQPKDRGGLGVRELKRVNRAMLAKTCWRLLKQPDVIWAKVLRGKYGVCSEDELPLKGRSIQSYTWRSVATLLSPKANQRVGGPSA